MIALVGGGKGQGNQVKDDNFLKKSGALCVARNGKAIQVHRGFSVGEVTESLEKLLK